MSAGMHAPSDGGATPSREGERATEEVARLAADLRLARQENVALRRDLRILADHVADLDRRLARLAPLAGVQSALGVGWSAALRGAALPIRAAGGLLAVGELGAAVRAARVRSQQIEWDEDAGAWRSRTDARRLARHLAGHLAPLGSTVYTVRPRQRLGLVRRPRVLHVIPNVWVGGSTQLVVDLHDHLGHRFEMAVATSALPRRGRHRGLATHLIPQPAAPHAVRQLLAGFRPGIVHVHYWGSVDEAWYRPFFEEAKAAGIPIVQNVNTPIAPFSGVESDRTVFVSRTIREQFGGGAGEVIHPGIDLDRFAPSASVPPGAFDSIGMVYRLERDKLNEEAIEPFIRVLRERPTTRAIIVGDGSLFGHFHARVAEEGLASRVEFTGAVPYAELPALMARFKIFVAPVWQESFGQVVPFAMSMGHAVAGHCVGALPEILDGTETLGGSVEDTSSRILDLLRDPARITALGERNRAIAREAFSVEGMARRYAELYTGLVPDEADLLPGYPAAVEFPL